MYPELLHIYGPFAINTFGVAIVIAIFLFSVLILHDSRTKKVISVEQFSNLLTLGIFAALIGARFLFVLGSPDVLSSLWNFFAIWNGGFSLLGAVIGPLIIVPIYTRYHHIALWPLLDIITTYAPLLQSIARIGCFFAGCCYGIPTSSFLGVTYCVPQSQMLQGTPTHPTQLYHAALLFFIFIIMISVIRRMKLHPGQSTMVYLLLMSLERFSVDFLRADREFISFLPYFSLSQYIALAILVISILGLFALSKKNLNEYI